MGSSATDIVHCCSRGYTNSKIYFSTFVLALPHQFNFTEFHYNCALNTRNIVLG